MDDLELALGLLGRGELVDLVLLHGGDALIFTLDGVIGDTGGSERLDDGVGDAGAGGIGGVAVRAVGDEADVDGGGVGHDDDFIGGSDGDGAVVLIDLNGLGVRWGGCKDDGGESEPHEPRHDSACYQDADRLSPRYWLSRRGGPLQLSPDCVDHS